MSPLDGSTVPERAIVARISDPCVVRQNDQNDQNDQKGQR
jgi:hypothetical protein